MTTPLLGAIVRYMLDEYDVTAINHRREAADGIGNRVYVGDFCPAMIVRFWGPASDSVNLQVFLDGNDTHWATSRHEGVRPGEWAVR